MAFDETVVVNEVLETCDMERLSQCDMQTFPLSHRAVLTDCAVLFVAEVCEGGKNRGRKSAYA